MTVCCPTCGSNVERIDPAKAVMALSLGGQERIIAHALLERFGAWVRTDHIITLLYGLRPDGGPVDARAIVSTVTCHLRAKLSSVGIAIETNNRGAQRRLTWSDAWATEKASAA